MSKVKVTADADGNVIVPSKNSPGYGYIRLEQDRAFVNQNNWVSVTTLSTLLYGTIDDLKKFNYTKDMLLPGNIIIKERLTPFNTETPEKDLKIAGKTGIACTAGGNPIYRKTFYNAGGNECDDLIDHDNSAEIKAAAKAESIEVVEESSDSDNFSL
jgi:hypothetical protein